MNEYTHIIRLLPLGPFFFGGENTFGDDNVNYFVRSNYLPQQTGLLGFLRYELLAQNGLLGTDPKEANWEKWIGSDSFRYTEAHKDNPQQFGAIEKLSPVFLSNGVQHYLPQAMDWALYDKEDNLAPLEVSMAPIGKVLTNDFKTLAPVAMAGGLPYNPKFGLKPLWVQADGKELHQWDCNKDFKPAEKIYRNGFFTAHEQTGIHRKTERSRQDTGNFYKQVLYRLANQLAFTFFVKLNLPEGGVLQSRIVTMGGERSAFSMTVEPATAGFDDLFTTASFQAGHRRRMNALVLTSDAYAPAAISSHCDFSITDTVPFRNIRTTQEANGNYARMKGKVSSQAIMEKTAGLTYLLRRGSVFYYTTDEQLKNLQDKLTNAAFRNIGYNHFLSLSR